MVIWFSLLKIGDGSGEDGEWKGRGEDVMSVLGS